MIPTLLLVKMSSNIAFHIDVTFWKGGIPGRGDIERVSYCDG
jgi:hypothetical protein